MRRSHYSLLLLFLALALMMLIVGDDRRALSQKDWERYFDPRFQHPLESLDALVGTLTKELHRLTSDPKLKARLLPAIQDGTIFQRLDQLTEDERGFVLGGFIGSYFNEMLNRLAPLAQPVTSDSQQIKIWIAPLDGNDAFLSRWPKDFNARAESLVTFRGTLIPMRYDDSINMLFIESRLPFPPLLHIASLIHEINHAFNDVVTTNNQPPPHDLLNNLDALEFEAAGHMAEASFWLWVGPRFMEHWQKFGLDTQTSHVPARILLEGLKAKVLCAREYLRGNRQPMLDYVKNLELGPPSEIRLSPKD